MPEVSAFGAVCALVIAIVMILRKVPPVFGMLAGALIGGLIGGVDLVNVIGLMTQGAQGMMPAVLRILAAGVLAGVLMESGAASAIAGGIVRLIGKQQALLALVFATLILTAVGVFVDIAVITVAPIALALAREAGYSRTAILVAMMGGGTCGNLMSPNPNTIAAADAFKLPLTSVMMAGIVPATVGIVVTYLIARTLKNKGTQVEKSDIHAVDASLLPGTFAALTAPLVTMTLLALRPIAAIAIDPMIALPAGGIVGAIVMGRLKHLNAYAVSGLGKMSGVAIMLIGTGTLAGIIANSGLSALIIKALQASGLPPFVLAPVSGALMSAATASTTAATVVASNVFSGPILELGVAPIAGAAMIHSGAVVFDTMPHGSFFHATGGATFMQVNERLKILPYEFLIGFSLSFVSTLVFGVFKLFP
ncbi:MAG: SLC13 family permease [Desulfobacterales bacterium]|nr:SLC13 family permease [Desulfobacterales bacterium]